MKEAGPRTRGNGKIIGEEAIGSLDARDLYLKDAGKYPLLTREEEVDLARTYEAGRRAKKILDSGKKLSRRKTADLEEKVGIGLVARDRLTNSNLKLVISVAKNYLNRGVAFLDLVQEGNFGLLKAVEKFDYRRGNKFSTYATWWIRQAVTRAIPEQGGGVRFPAHAGDAFDRIAKTEASVERKNGQKLTLKELSEVTGLSEKKIKRLMLSPRNPLSLDNPIRSEEGDSATLGEFIEDEEVVDPLEAAHVAMKLKTVYRALGRLTAREETVLRLRSVHTLEETGKKLGVTRERVRQIEAKALEKLRAKPELLKYLEK